VIAEQKGKVTANRVRGTIATFFAWAMREGIVDANPVIGTNKFEEKSRSRVLTDDELSTIWKALEDDHFGAIMKLLALTACRASEIADLRWTEIGEDAIILPPERTKSARLHLVPLSGPAAAIIAAQPRRTNSDGTARALVFGIGQGGFCGWDPCMRRLNARIAAANGVALPHWTPHDLRRTCRTRMAALKVPPHVAEAVLNHSSGHMAGVGAIYDRWSYEPEKRQALNLWADRLMAVVEGREINVVTLQRA
jgi:integrase